MIERKKWDYLAEIRARTGSRTLYINATPKGVYQFDLGAINASGDLVADAVRLRLVDGSITAEGFLTANAGFEFDVHGDVVATGTLNALAGII